LDKVSQNIRNPTATKDQIHSYFNFCHPLD
jgi:hypothetical protein